MSPPRPPAPSRPERPLSLVVDPNALDAPGTGEPERDPNDSGPELTNRELVQSIVKMSGEQGRRLTALEEAFSAHAQADAQALGELRDIGLRTEASIELVRATVVAQRRDIDATARTAEDAQRTADKADTALAVQGQRAASVLLEAGEKVAADVVAARGDRRKIVAAVLGGGGVITLLIELARALLLRGG